MREVPKPRPTIESRIDRLVGLFSPRTAYRRKFYRQMSKLSSQAYDAASTARGKKNWMGSGGSPDADILGGLPRQRERSRDLNRNDAHAAGITGTVTTNVVGTGIKPQCRIGAYDIKRLGLSDEAVNDYQNAAEQVWRAWTPYADASERLTFNEIQSLVLRQILENGEVFIVPLMLRDGSQTRPYELALEIIEADRVDTPVGMASDKSVRSGVKVGDRGQPLGYYILETHPGDATYADAKKRKSFCYVPAFNEYGRRNILHLYPQLRPGQTRGVPFFAPVIALFKDLADYLEAEIVAAKAAACLAIFVKVGYDAYEVARGASDTTDSAGKRVQTVEPGQIYYQQPGEEIQIVDPKRPGQTFDPFVERILRAIGVGLELPYELIAKDFSKTNYSSARAALLEARRFFKHSQKWMEQRLCQPVWELLLIEALLKGELPVNNFFAEFRAYTQAKWTSDGWEWVDPQKEVKAANDAISGQIRTLQSVASDRGDDWEEVLEQLARENKKREELGLPLPGATPASDIESKIDDLIDKGDE